jgi:hypothetical protein
MHKKIVVLLAVLALIGAMLGLQSVSLAASSWHDIGGSLSSTTVRSLAYDSARDLLYAGTTTGIWRCTSPYANPSWTKISAVGNIGSYIIPDIAYDGVRNILYAAANSGSADTDGKGVWRNTSPDGASSWSLMTGAGDISNHIIYGIAVDASLRNKLYVSCGGGLWRCGTPGTAPTWTTPMAPGTRGLCYDAGRNFLFIAMAAPVGGSVFLSSNPDAGFGLTNLNGPGPVPYFEIVSMSYDTVHNILFAGSFTNGLFRCATPNTAPAWTNIGNVFGSNTVNALCYNGVDNVLYAGLTNNMGVYKSSNPNAAAPSWASLGAPVSGFSVNALAYNAAHSLYAGTGSHGVWRYGEQFNPVWFLAEGSTNWGFSCYISLENPNPSVVNTRITYMTNAGPVDGGVIPLAAMSQTTVNPADKIGAVDFSTRVECLEGKTIAVDRTMSWQAQNSDYHEYHSSVGVTEPAKNWYLPEGSSQWGFECWLLIQNPNPTDVTCTVTYMIEGGSAQTFQKPVPANTRRTFNMADDIGAKDASIKVSCASPVIPERAMYRNSRRMGHDSIGTITPALDYYLAEGTSAWGFTTYVLIQNPNATETKVDVIYMTNAGPVPHPQNPITMPANSRKTIRVNDFLSNRDFSTLVSSEGPNPIIAERAMYWDNGTGEAGHDSIGMDEPHTTFYLPDGAVNTTNNAQETWTLVQNPNSSSVNVRISYLMSSGVPVVFTDTVGGNSRKTYNMADKIGASGRAAVMVECLTANKRIMVERAMYWTNRGGGTDTIGGSTD